jgi:hypothetical protein
MQYGHNSKFHTNHFFHPLILLLNQTSKFLFIFRLSTIPTSITNAHSEKL